MGNNFFDIFTKENVIDTSAEQPANPVLEYAAKFVDLQELPLDPEKIPAHIAVVMDGNGRWANKRSLPRTIGHRQGVMAVENLVEACSNLGVEYLTIYAFSTENWKRSKDEISALMQLLVEFAYSKLKKLCENRVRVRVIGDLERLPQSARKALVDLVTATAGNKGLTMNMAINYGSRAEILRAVSGISEQLAAGSLHADQIDDQLFNSYLYTAGQPDPDLLIRTSGEQRLSNFLLWQLAYAEFYFTEVLWPDFDEKELIKAIYYYQSRDRRFGGVK